MKNRKIIGILGGMGPSASGYLFNMINSLAAKEYGARRNQDFPETILYSVPVPDFISSNRNKEKALKMLIDKVRQTNQLSITAMGIACNTAHILLPQLQRASKARFTSMIEKVSDVVVDKKIQTIGLLATSSTIRSKIYQEELEKRTIRVVIPNNADQKKIDRIIKLLVANKGGGKEQKDLVNISTSLKKQGVKGIILGCTELPLLFPKQFSVPVFNSVEILARTLLQEAYGLDSVKGGE